MQETAFNTTSTNCNDAVVGLLDLTALRFGVLYCSIVLDTGHVQGGVEALTTPTVPPPLYHIYKLHQSSPFLTGFS